MSPVMQMTFACTFPLVCLALVMWLSHLEDTLAESVRRSMRRPDPPPVLRVPVRARPVAVMPEPGVQELTRVPFVPVQRVPEQVAEREPAESAESMGPAA